MRLIFALVAVLMTMSVNAQDLSVMTYNLRLDLESDKVNAWSNRKEEAIQLILNYAPDVLGVQEPVPGQMRDLRTALVSYGDLGVARDDGKDKGEYSAIFYKKEVLDVVKTGTFWLSETPERPSKGWDAAYNRICTYALFKTKKGNQHFWAFNIHFDHVGDEARKNSAKLLLEKIKTFNTKNYPVVLTGDFNLTDETEPIKILSHDLKDSFYHSKKKPYGPKGTFQAFDTTVPASERIDYIFTKGFSVETLTTIDDRRENLLYPSDHYPVLAELKFQK